jgi:flagellar basal body-associated protein FliL
MEKEYYWNNNLEYENLEYEDLEYENLEYENPDKENQDKDISGNQKKSMIIIISMIVGVIIVAFATKLWMNANGIHPNSMSSGMVKSGPVIVGQLIENEETGKYDEMSTEVKKVIFPIA